MNINYTSLIYFLYHCTCTYNMILPFFWGWGWGGGDPGYPLLSVWNPAYIMLVLQFIELSGSSKKFPWNLSQLVVIETPVMQVPKRVHEFITQGYVGKENRENFGKTTVFRDKVCCTDVTGCALGSLKFSVSSEIVFTRTTYVAKEEQTKNRNT